MLSGKCTRQELEIDVIVILVVSATATRLNVKTRDIGRHSPSNTTGAVFYIQSAF